MSHFENVIKLLCISVIYTKHVYIRSTYPILCSCNYHSSFALWSSYLLMRMKHLILNFLKTTTILRVMAS